MSKVKSAVQKSNVLNFNLKLYLLRFTFCAIFFAFCALPFALAFSSPVFAQALPAAPKGCKYIGTALECEASGIIQLQQVLTRIINISVTIAFMALTVWLVWSALKFFITSGGDPKALSHAWSSVTWAFMGLFFMVLAYLILKLILAVTGADVTQYCLGFPPYCM